MKILHALFEIQDYGGIVPYVETLTRAFQEDGHEVRLALLRPNPRVKYIRKKQKPSTEYASYIPGAQVHLLSGWYGVPVFGFTEDRPFVWWDYASEFDLVIFHTAPKATDPGWSDLFVTGAQNIFVAHDAHYHRAYEHLDLVHEHLVGAVCVHEAAYNNMEDYPGRRALIGNPHVLADWNKTQRWKVRSKASVCAHVWKGWKRMHRYVAAAPFMKTQPIMGGDGIEGRYMRSPTKCPKKYEGLWDKYLASGGQYVGIVQPAELASLYRNNRVMVDLSASKRFAFFGNHVNRSTFDAWNYGMVPVGTEMNMGAWRNGPFAGAYFPVPHTGTPEQLAELIDTAVNLSPLQAANYIETGRKIMRKHYEYHHVAYEIILFAEGIPVGQERNYD